MFAKRCVAKARTNDHKPCRQPAMANRRCRLHGGKSIGPKTEVGRQLMIQANTKQEFYSAESIAERKQVRELIKATMGNV